MDFIANLIGLSCGMFLFFGAILAFVLLMIVLCNIPITLLGGL